MVHIIREAIHTQFAGNPAFGPALLEQGHNRLLLIHFELIHCPESSQIRNTQSNGSPQRVGDFNPRTDKEGRILYADGICPHTTWLATETSPPLAIRGVLLVKGIDIVPGISTRLVFLQEVGRPA